MFFLFFIILLLCFIVVFVCVVFVLDVLCVWLPSGVINDNYSLTVDCPDTHCTTVIQRIQNTDEFTVTCVFGAFLSFVSCR